MSEKIIPYCCNSEARLLGFWAQGLAEQLTGTQVSVKGRTPMSEKIIPYCCDSEASWIDNGPGLQYYFCTSCRNEVLAPSKLEFVNSDTQELDINDFYNTGPFFWGFARPRK